MKTFQGQERKNGDLDRFSILLWPHGSVYWDWALPAVHCWYRSTND